MAHEHSIDFGERFLPCLAVIERIANFQDKLQVFYYIVNDYK